MTPPPRVRSRLPLPASPRRRRTALHLKRLLAYLRDLPVHARGRYNRAARYHEVKRVMLGLRRLSP